MNDMNILQIKNLKKSFGSKEVLDGLDLSVPEHSIFGFIGKNGAGKTTTMKAILGLLQSDGGEIYIMGEKVHYGQTSTNRYIGYLPDVPEFYSYMTPLEYLNFCGEVSGMDKSDIVTRSKEMLELVGLGHEHRRIKGFSRGMKQRLGIAQALLNRPKLLNCDEPTSALDPAGRKEILEILLAVKEQTTVLFSTHILSDVERICTESAFLHEGKIVLQGEISELRNHRTSDGYVIEIEKEEDAKTLIKVFDDLSFIESSTLIFHGDEECFFAIMQYIAKNKIRIRRMERMEPTLETVFLEVTK
jgi:ABC-2 type transport system ATP-binding protein